MFARLVSGLRRILVPYHRLVRSSRYLSAGIPAPCSRNRIHVHLGRAIMFLAKVLDIGANCPSMCWGPVYHALDPHSMAITVVVMAR